MPKPNKTPPAADGLRMLLEAKTSSKPARFDPKPGKPQKSFKAIKGRQGGKPMLFPGRTGGR